jgi:adenylate kinase family enzyme
MAESLGITIDLSTGLHPEVSRDYELILQNSQVPDSFKILARRAKEIFDITEHDILFQFLHNDAHHENVLIKNKQISGIIDFGNAEYGEIAKEFSRYIRDFPFHFQYIVSAYEKASGNKLSYTRLVTNSFLSGLIDTVGDYLKGGEGRVNAEKAMARYKKLIDTYTQTQNPKRILIVGDAGRGKSTFAKKLSAKLGIPAYETDDFYWIKKFSVPANKQESIDAIAKVYLEDTWIVEGTTRHLVQGAFEKADVIYSLEFKWIISQYYRLIKRSFGRDHESWRGLWVLLVHVTRKRFKKGYRAELPSIQEMIKPYESKVVHLCSFKEIQSELHKYNL